jgi:ArsR family transcriptional regulator
VPAARRATLAPKPKRIYLSIQMNGSRNGAAPAIFDRMSALADTTRSRLLLVLERHELTVGELCSVVQLPQSTVSRHLKLLGDEEWVASRAEGTSRRYRMPADRLDPSALRLWQIVREQAATLPAAAQDATRLGSVLAVRTTQSRAFFSSSAGQWDRLRCELFGERTDLVGLLALLDEEWTVGDLGCGTGRLAQALAPFVRSVVAVDASPAMLEAARARLGDAANVEVRAGELESLPVANGELDAAVVSLVLHYVAEPEAALAEAFRALRPGGRLLVVDMMPHDREEFRQTMGHVWQGFGAEALGRWLAAAGFGAARYTPLPPDPAAKGPTLFAASARKP